MWFQAYINRTAGEIALLSPDRDADAVKAQAYFGTRARNRARAQQARSWDERSGWPSMQTKSVGLAGERSRTLSPSANT